ncbi:MAG: group 1 truncated hemoglobin [Oligoflexia bacterium]|nr:group 1 truncated hemoglobin [Oligoflexia bacterium]
MPARSDHKPELSLSKPALRAIYQNIGGADGLRAILRDFYARMKKDIIVGFFFTGFDTDLIAERQHAFLSRAMGATPSYSGKPPAQAHLELPPILPGHFDRRLRILEETLRDHGVSAEDIRIWVEFESTFRPGIVSPSSD